MDAKAVVGKLDKLFMDFYILFDYINILRCCITILARFSCEDNGSIFRTNRLTLILLFF